MGTPRVTLRRKAGWTETVEEGASILISPAGGAELAPVVREQRLRWIDGVARPRTACRAGDAAGRVVSAVEPLVR